LPIRGDLNDPDFKYGRVVWSTLGNLLTKVAASPFSLIGKLVPGGGDAEELQFVAFEPGSGTVPDAERKKLEILMKGLEERPGLRLDITGTADRVRDRRALGYAQLQGQVLARWRQEQGSPKETTVPPEQEARLVKELFDQQFTQPAAPPTPAAPGKSGAESQPPTVEEMKQRLVAAMPLDENSLRGLAQQRAENARQQIVGGGKLPEERVYLTEVSLEATGQEQVRTSLSIGAGS
jgi:hypothetical protein